jgi:hypothetical protein
MKVQSCCKGIHTVKWKFMTPICRRLGNVSCNRGFTAFSPRNPVNTVGTTHMWSAYWESWLYNECFWFIVAATGNDTHPTRYAQGIFSYLRLILMRGCCSGVVLATICQPDLGSCCRFGFLPPHHGGSNPYKVLQDPNGVQVRQPKESRAKKNYVIRSHELAAMIHMYRGHSISFLFLRHDAISYWCLPTCLLPAVISSKSLSVHDDQHIGWCDNGHPFLRALKQPRVGSLKRSCMCICH